MRISGRNDDENRKEIEPFFFSYEQTAQVENHTRKLMMMERLL